jgi:hypothetical protein
MTIIGTSYFPTRHDAIKYYSPVCDEDIGLLIDYKIKLGEINIGKPNLKPGETLFIKDNRYFIQEMRIKK